MKIAIVGCGAVGSYYGARLAMAGHEVHFLLRTDFNHVKENGVWIRSIDGHFHVRPIAANNPTQIGIVDVILIALKSTANHCFKELLTPLTGPDSLLVTLQNGLGNEEQLAAIFGPGNILGGLCFVCLNRIAPGIIRHTAHGRIVLGEFTRKPQKRTLDLAVLFNQAGIPCSIAEDMGQAHWEKLIWNIPFNGLGVAGVAGYEAVISGNMQIGVSPGPTLPTDSLLNSTQWYPLIQELMQEVISTARMLGYSIDYQLADENIRRTRIMGAYKASTLLDFEKGLELEIDSLFLEPLRQAQKVGAKVPRLAALCQVLLGLQKSKSK